MIFLDNGYDNGYSLKIGLIPSHKVKEVSMMRFPKLQLQTPPFLKVQTLELIKVSSLRASCPKLSASKMISVRTQLLEPVDVEILPYSQPPRLLMPLIPIMKLPLPQLFKIEPSQVAQEPQLKSKPTVTMIPKRIPLYKSPKVKSMPTASFGIRREVPAEEAPIFIREKVGAAPKLEAPEIEALELVEVPEFLDLFLEPLDKEGGGLGGLLTANRPVCIILSKPENDSYVDAIGIICREIYRMKKGGKPIPKVLSTGGKEEIEELLKAGDRIFIIDDSKSEFFNLSKVKGLEDINWSMLHDRLRELFSQDFGFIIFHINRRWIESFTNRLLKIEYIIPSLVRIKPRDADIETKRWVSEMSWGFAIPKIETGNFDEVFCKAEQSFYNKVEEISDDKWLMHCVKPHKNGEESHEHRLIKALVVKILAKEMDLKKKDIPKKILTEPVISGVKPDVYVPLYKENKSLAVEVETFYETGFRPIDKVDHETLRKYVDAGLKNPVWVIMMNLPMLMYFSEIKDLKRIYKDEYDLDVQFYAIDIENERLVSLDKISKQLIGLREKKFMKMIPA